MVSMLVLGASGPGSRTGRGHGGVVFLFLGSGPFLNSLFKFDFGTAVARRLKPFKN